VSELNEPVGSEAPKGISRRTVTKAMAWAVPVIAVAAPVPAYAASQINFSLNGAGCKLPGNSNSTYKGYAFALVINNTSSVVITINITSITLNGVSLGDSALVNLNTGTLDPNPFVLAANQSLPAAALLTEGAGNSSNGTLSITYTINNGTPIVVTATVPSAPPINGASCDAFTPAQKVVLANISGLPPLWTANTAYVQSANVRLSTGGGVILVANNAGTSGAAEPVAPASVGLTVVDGSITWTRIQ
jgi:hypothetical protein